MTNHIYCDLLNNCITVLFAEVHNVFVVLGDLLGQNLFQIRWVIIRRVSHTESWSNFLDKKTVFCNHFIQSLTLQIKKCWRLKSDLSAIAGIELSWDNKA